MPGVANFDHFQGYRLLCLNENCEKTFKNEATRQYHMKHTCNRPPRFKCAYCGHTSHFSKDIKRHSESKHPGMFANILELFDPGLPFLPYPEAFVARRRGRPPKPNFPKITPDHFVCPHLNCQKMFKNEDSLRIHLKYICNKPPRFKCGYCQYKAPRISNVKIHSNNIHKGSPLNIIELYKTGEEFASFVCPNENCQKKYKIKYDLNKHLKYECGKAPCFKCFHCDFQNSFIGRINTHCRLKHPDQEIKYLTTTAYNFEYPVTDFSLQAFPLFLNDVLSPAAPFDQSLPSEEPPEPSAQPIGLSCPHKNCRKTFKTEKSLKKHLQSNCQQPRYHCGYCDFKAVWLSSAKNHASQKHGGMKTNILSITKLTAKITPKMSAGTYQCPNDNCKKRYKSAADCRAHVKYECGKPPRFKCFYCDFRKNLFKRMKPHWREKHPDKEFLVVNMME
ncbi:hypothetical protein KQX54_003784 [Cotesia glomerata]|uniref:C2H2-type domain-containing protein n=1 Tax=Cotesia glomerata TaxID=32391 RepID=A0AAV7IMG5_COTGL|nr:hypothetical protein KQX54_003784 [Cotesia glomerata]